MRHVLIIDDDDELDPRPEGAVQAYDHIEAVVALRSRSAWHEVWFDHDLGPRGDSMKVVEYLEERQEAGDPVRIDAVYVHSMNPSGAENLVKALSRLYPTRRVTLPWIRTTRSLQESPHAAG